MILLVGACPGKGAATVDHRRVETNDHAVAAGHSVDPARWQEAFEGLMDRISGRLARVEPRRHVRQLALGLLSDLPRKNCWTIAEWAGETTPDGMQHLLGRAKWDADQIRDDVREYVVEHLRDDQAVLVADETGDVKKGTRTVGVQRQYTGTAGRIENSQVARSTWSTPVGAGMRRWTENYTSRAPGQPTPIAAGPPGWARKPGSRPNRSRPPA